MVNILVSPDNILGQLLMYPDFSDEETDLESLLSDLPECLWNHGAEFGIFSSLVYPPGSEWRIWRERAALQHSRDGGWLSCPPRKKFQIHESIDFTDLLEHIGVV